MQTLVPVLLVLSLAACGSDPSGATTEPLIVDAGPDAAVDAAPDGAGDARPDAPANCSLDQGKYAAQPYTCPGGLWLCSSAPDAGAPPWPSCARPGPVVSVVGVEWTTWCCQ